jgi:transposase
MTKKSPMQKYTLANLQKEFPNDAACLEWLKSYRWPEGIFCENCNKVTTHHLMNTRRSFSCQECGHHVHPTAGTIFHKSDTPLVVWFYTAYLMAQTRGGISAKQVQRETGVTYKTAWRMCNLIRRMLDEDKDPFNGEVEVDETYVGGKNRGGKRGRGSENKTPVVGVVQRKGKIKAVVVPDTKSKTVLPIVDKTVEKGTQIYTDEYPVYDRLATMGYSHDRILHSQKIYVMGDVHTNTIEGFWSLAKNGIRGVFHSVSPKYLQDYMNEYAFRYNHRDDETPMFISVLQKLGLRGAQFS